MGSDAPDEWMVIRINNIKICISNVNTQHAHIILHATNALLVAVQITHKCSQYFLWGGGVHRATILFLPSLTHRTIVVVQVLVLLTQFRLRAGFSCYMSTCFVPQWTTVLGTNLLLGIWGVHPCTPWLCLWNNQRCIQVRAQVLKSRMRHQTRFQITQSPIGVQVHDRTSLSSNTNHIPYDAANHVYDATFARSMKNREINAQLKRQLCKSSIVIKGFIILHS